MVATRFRPTELRKLLLVFGACTAALFINPFGYKLVLYPFDFQFHQQRILRYSSYWQPVDFSARSGRLALVLIFAMLAAALFSKRQWRLTDVLLSAFGLWAALSHARLLDFAGLIIAPILAPHLALFPPYNRDEESLG